MMQVLFVIVCFSFCNGLLLNNGVASSGNNMSDKHFVYVMDQILQDRQSMKIMETIVLQLQQEMNSTKQELMSLKQGKVHLQNLEISQLKTVSMTLKQTVTKLQNELADVKTDNNVLNENNKHLYMRLQNEISACNNKTLNISEELDKFTHSSADQLKNVTELNANVNSLNKKTDTVNVMINSLTSSSKALGQDLLALLNKTIIAEKKIEALVIENMKVSSELNQLTISNDNLLNKTTTAEKKIGVLVTDNKKVSSELNQLTISNDNLLNKTTRAEKKIGVLVTENIKVSSELNHLSYNQNSTIQKIDEVFHKISDINQTVALSSCSTGETIGSSATIVKFPATKTVYGISDINGFRTSGKFVCEVPGVYLFSVHIMSESNYAYYIMFKNNMVLSLVYVIYTSQPNGSHYNTGTGVMAVQLNVGDTLYVKAYRNMHIVKSWSCMTIIKIR